MEPHAGLSPDVRIDIRWDARGKVWRIRAVRGGTTVRAVAKTTVGIDRVDVVRLAGAVRRELESWLPLR